VFALLIALFGCAHAETADEIVARARAANQLSSSVQHIKMTLVSKSGSTRVMEVDLKSRKAGDVNQSYMRVTAPSTQAGTTLLLLDKPGAADEQLMYLPPPLGRVNMINGSARKGFFLGSDFAYEDFEFRDATVGGMALSEDRADAWVLETAPTNSTYTKVKVTINKSNLVISKVEFFDANGLLKVLEVKSTAVDNGVTIAVHTEMTNVVKGTKTVLEVTSHQLNVGPDVLPDETFTRGFLERG
jgi:hypothetical protein